MCRTRFISSCLLVLVASIIALTGCSSEDRAAQRENSRPPSFEQIQKSIELSSEDEHGINQFELDSVTSKSDAVANKSRPVAKSAPTTSKASRQPSIAHKKTSRPMSMPDDIAVPNTIEFEPRDLESATAGSAPDEAVASEPSVAIADEQAGMTTVEVFYATDRKSSSSLTTEDWMEMHWTALLSGLVYLIAFGAVFFSQRKVLCGLIAIISLGAFLYLGQSATLKWQTAKRLDENGDVRYLSQLRDSGPALDYGKCEVSIPANHKIGQIDRPSLIKLEFSENPDKHMVLKRVMRSSKDQFYNDMLDTLEEKNSLETLVFIHGYNVSFENAVKRTAQITHDLEFNGAPVCYSWSSYGSLANYTHDMANADATVVPLHDFLLELVERTGNSTVHLVAHSMGNRALLQVLDRIAVGNSDNRKLFGQLVMAAPDVSAHDFKSRYANAAMELADIVTLYASSNDRALIASTEIHGHNRAGLAGDHLVTLKGIDTVDVSEIDTSFLGHSYYGNHPDLIKDLQAVVELSQPASKRRWLTQILDSTGIGYFRFADLTTRSATSPAPEPTHR